MIGIEQWMKKYLEELDGVFGNRVWFVGLQGSYARDEATEDSDIDTVVILDRVTPEEIRSYSAMLDTLPHRDRICGFFSGKEELLSWEPADLFQFYHDTLPIRGSLDCLLTRVDKASARRAVHTGLCNLYHGCVHNMLHGKSDRHLQGLYKSAAFVIQAICYLETGCYFRKQQALLEQVSSEDRRILETSIRLKNGGQADFLKMSEELFLWCQNRLTQRNL